MKVFALTSQGPSRDRRANQKTTIAYAAYDRNVARPNFGENRSQGNRHDYFRAHAREMRPQIAETEANRLPALQLRIAQQRAPMLKVRAFARGCRGGDSEGVRNRWQRAAWKWCAETCQRFQTPLEVTQPDADASGSSITCVA
jgi:hypothetical protein